MYLISDANSLIERPPIVLEFVLFLLLFFTSFEFPVTQISHSDLVPQKRYSYPVVYNADQGTTNGP